MCIADFLKERAEGMGPNEQLTIDRAWIEWVLEHHVCECHDSAHPPAPASFLGYTVAELATLYTKSPSAIKAWCATGVFGDPGTLKPDGSKWLVTPEKVTDLNEKLAAGYRITGDGLVEPAAPSQHHLGTPALRPASTPPTAGLRDSSSSLKRRARRGRHNEWRQYV